MEFLFIMCVILVLFSLVFIMVPFVMGFKDKTVQSMNVIFLWLFTLLMGMVFAIFVKWFIKYKNSLIRFR